ncbi:hypothetical protein QUF72_12720 [Desulfobacterales bacterium HSG2]|nr:hypothetical protein [Desulfobacterales bacterium HSG2]
MESDVQIFINEYSLQEQFFDDAEFENAVVTLSLLVSRVRKRKIDLEGDLIPDTRVKGRNIKD